MLKMYSNVVLGLDYLALKKCRQIFFYFEDIITYLTLNILYFTLNILYFTLNIPYFTLNVLYFMLNILYFTLNITHIFQNDERGFVFIYLKLKSKGSIDIELLLSAWTDYIHSLNCSERPRAIIGELNCVETLIRIVQDYDIVSKQ